MNIVYGFGGMRSDGELLSFNPSIPEHWKAYSFQVIYHSSVLRVEVAQGMARFSITEGEPVIVNICGQEMEVNRVGISIEI
jgi:maltose phosphorylase